MLIIGEKINTVNPRVRRAVEERDTAHVQRLALSQAAAGADVIDVNVGGLPGAEPELMQWAVCVVQEVTDLPLAIDSADPATVRAGLSVCAHPERAWANSVTLERGRLQGLLPAVREYGCRLVALCIDERGVPPDAAGRLEVAGRLVDEVQRWGVSLERLYVDCLVQPVSVEPEAARVSLETIRSVRSALSGIKTVICLSGVSFGLPARRLLNRAYLPLLAEAGVDAIFLDPLDRALMSVLRATRVLLAEDACGLEYIAAHRAGHLV
ncbi:MAG: dihydropteroate synthase [Anaerolineae bacterium]|nr:dihydropteroate synthase [Anaerolineae bacterium]